MKLHPLLAIALVLTTAGPARSASCERTLGLHGFKAMAQMACHFGQRENQALEWARSCARRQDPGTNTEEIRRGAETFQATARRMGRTAACEDVLGRFGGVLYRIR